MGLLVFLIFENNNLLNNIKKHESIRTLAKKSTYKADIPSREDQRKASHGNKTQLPYEHETQDRTRDNSSDGLNDTRGAKLIR